MTQYPVLLVGSIAGFDSETEVFENVVRVLGSHVKRIPDGETGPRAQWIGWQNEWIAQNPSLQRIPPERVHQPKDRPTKYKGRPQYEVVLSGLTDTLRFADLGYATAARHSYKSFADLKKSGRIASGTRFQVSLPTPMAIAVAYFDPASQKLAEPALEARMLEEVREILGFIPHDQLAIQWDVAVEVQVLEGLAFAHFENLPQGVTDRLVRLGEAVPTDVELGYHLCYGDYGHRHFKEPEDTALLVEMANALFEAIQRRVTWLHLPVPRNRDDDNYYAPLRHLNLPRGTELYLGLVHFSDGIEGARRRMTVASRYCKNFGISTECGLGRRPPETIQTLLEIHRHLAAG